MAQQQETGKTGENIALVYLQNLGYQLVHTNFRHGRYEVDIIAEKDKTLHFIEVKTKAGQGLGLPEQRVDSGKIGRMKRVAEYYLYQNPGWQFVQFDIISITMQQGLEPEIFMIEDIF
jgi:putative endonuclease